MDVYLKNEKEKEEFHFPVNPIEKIIIKRSKKYETVDIIDFGEADIVSLGKNIKELGFDTILPGQLYNFCRYTNIPDVNSTIDKLEKWMNQKDPVRLIITGFNFNDLVIISDFSVEERSGEIGDRYISIAFRLYRELKIEALPIPPKPPSLPPKAVVKPSTNIMIVTNVTTRLNVRSGPGTSYSILGKLYQNNEVEVYEIKNGWATIKYSKGKDGKAYVSSNYLKNKPAPPPLNNNRPSSNSGKKVHTVTKGDTLWGISKKYYGQGDKWTNIYNVPENKKTIGNNPNIIKIGQKLIIP